jgi:uncharacterized protein
MLLNCLKIPEGRSVLSQNVTIEGEQWEWISCVGDVHCRAEIDRIPSQISVHVFYQGIVTLECSRCLKKYDRSLAGDFYIVMKKRSSGQAASKVPVEEDDFFFDDETDEIDLSGALFDDMVLAVPMKPLCSEDCLGIPLLKKDAIDVSQAKTPDTRWEALMKLKDRI